MATATLPVPCSFCGRLRRGGVAGPEPPTYICPDCIRLAADLLREQHRPGLKLLILVAAAAAAAVALMRTRPSGA